MCGLASGCPHGSIVEVGVYKGGSARYLYDVAESQSRELYLYDTFTGIPCRNDKWDQHDIGDFGDVSINDMRYMRESMPNANIIIGKFPDSMVPMGNIAFVHADCDQYESVKAVIEKLGPMVVPGGIIYFDDYLMYGVEHAIKEAGLDVTLLHNGKAYARY